jgi:single-strand DNA-binding protein
MEKMSSAKKTVARRAAPARPQAPVSVPRSAGRGDKPRGMRSVNRVVLLGALGQDAETRYTQSGTAVTQFSVATNRSWKDGDSWKEETQWTRVVMWAQEKTAEYLTKGKQVYIEGRLSTRSYEDKDGKTVWATEVVTDQVILLGGGSDAREQNQSRGQRDQISDDDVPF